MTDGWVVMIDTAGSGSVYISATTKCQSLHQRIIMSASDAREAGKLLVEKADEADARND